MLRILVLAAAAALLAAGCGDSDDGGGSEAQTTAAPAETTDAGDGERDGERAGGEEAGMDPAPDPARERPRGTAIKAGDSQFGEVLFDGDNQAIYLFDKETGAESECYGECADAWPPVLTEGRPRAKGPISQGKLGTTERDDGETQVTYAGHPLYYYHDEAPTEVRCHNVPGFGGLWLALTPEGDPA